MHRPFIKTSPNVLIIAIFSMLLFAKIGKQTFPQNRETVVRHIRHFRRTWHAQTTLVFVYAKKWDKCCENECQRLRENYRHRSACADCAGWPVSILFVFGIVSAYLWTILRHNLAFCQKSCILWFRYYVNDQFGIPKFEKVKSRSRFPRYLARLWPLGGICR